MERVERVFVKHFANGNRRKGMKVLRPTVKRERHRVTFLLGINFVVPSLNLVLLIVPIFIGFVCAGGFTGFALALIIAIVVALHTRKILIKKEHDDIRNAYMNNIFPLYRYYLNLH